jgi:hypothetical protein
MDFLHPTLREGLAAERVRRLAAAMGPGTKKPPVRGLLEKRMMGLEPTTFCMASRRSSQLSYIRGPRKYSLRKW